jgi:iron complex outermembrane receptor protein
MTRKIHPASAALLGTTLALSAPLALAQENAPADVLEEITITASKRATNLLETPLAVTALTAESLEREGVKTARDLTGMVPNLQFATGPDSGTAITVRGVVSTDFTEVGDGAMAVHLDGFYSPRPQGILALMYDLERVEVLRGPQGTLFGMNASGGVINVIPAAPQFDRTFASLDGTLGNYKERELRGVLNFAISDTFAIRLAAMAERHDGMMTQLKDTTDIAWEPDGIGLDGIPDVDQRRNADVSRSDWYNNSDQSAARLIARWQATDWLSVSGTLSHFLDRGAGDIDYVDCEQAAGTINECNHTLRWANINVPGKKHLTIDDYQLKISAALNERMALEYRVSRQNQERHQLADIDGGTRPPDEWASIGEPTTPEAELTGYYPIWDENWETKHSRYDTTTHELQFKSTGEGKLQWVTGLFYLNENKQIRYDMEMLNNKSYYVDPELPLGFNPDGLPDSWVFDQKERTTTSKAAFVQFDYRFLPKLNATVGYRYSDDRKTDNGGMTYAFWQGDAGWYNGEYEPTGVRAHQSSDLTDDMGSGAPLGTVMPASDPNTVAQSWSSGTYRVGLQYFPRDGAMLFGSVATGHKMGGMYEMADFCNNGCLQLLEYGPEEVKTYELGYKTRLLDGKLQLSATAFLSNYNDMQNTGDKVVGTDENPESPNFGDPVTAWTTDNLTRSRIKGVELEFDLIPWHGGRLNGYVTWLDTEIIDGGSYQDGYACAEREIYGQTPCASEATDITGNSLPFAPDYALTLNYNHSVEMSGGYSLEPQVVVHWQSKMWFDINNYDGAHLSQSQDAYAKVDLGLRLTGPEGRYYVELFGENVTDEDTKNFSGFNRGVVKANYDLPRTFGLRAGYSFGR